MSYPTSHGPQQDYPQQQPTQGWPGPVPYGPPPRRLTIDFAGVIAPIAVGVLGLVAVLFGLGPYASDPESSKNPTLNFYEAPWAAFIVLPLLVAGLVCLFGLLPRQKPALALSLALSAATVIVMLFYLASFHQLDDSVTTGWAYWIVFFIALLQTAAALVAMLLPTVNPAGPQQAPPPGYGQAPAPQTGGFTGPQQYGPPSASQQSVPPQSGPQPYGQYQAGAQQQYGQPNQPR